MAFLSNFEVFRVFFAFSFFSTVLLPVAVPRDLTNQQTSSVYDIRNEAVRLDSGKTKVVTASNLTQTIALSVSDWSGDNDGYPEPREFVTIRFPLTNTTGKTARNVRVHLQGGGTVNYGSLSSGYSRSGEIPFTIPAGSSCGNNLALTFDVTSSLGPVNFSRQIFIGRPQSVSSAENFDGVTAPAIPDRWATTITAKGFSFETSTTVADTAPNAMFASAPQSAGGGTDLTSPRISIDSEASTISFRNRYDTEVGRAGGALEISISGGEFQDFIAAGGTFLQNGYNGSLEAGRNNPIADRNAWTGNSGGYLTTVAKFPTNSANRVVQLRFRFGSEGTVMSVGWSIDSVILSNAGFISSFDCSLLSDLRSRGDFDGDGKTDLSVYRPSDGTWLLNRSTLGISMVQFGAPGNVPAPGDYDGDGITDIAVWDPNDRSWKWISSDDNVVTTVSLGEPGDIPQPADLDGDGRDDQALYRPSTGQWLWRNSGNGSMGTVQFGGPGDIPTMGDYDGDGMGDISIYRPSLSIWYRINSGDGLHVAEYFGLSQDLPVNADFDGDKKEDIAVFRPSDGTWYYRGSLSGVMVSANWGSPGDIPVSGDFDGNGTADLGVFRNGRWYILYLNGSFSNTVWGLASDIPVTKRPFQSIP